MDLDIHCGHLGPCKVSLYALYWSARLGETRCGFWHPLETFTSSARRSIHPPGSVSPLPFPLLGLFLCCCGLAARESDTSFCHGFTIADIWSTTLRVVSPAATFPEALSLVQEQKAELGVTSCWKACEDPCVLQTGSGTLSLGRHFINIFDLCDFLNMIRAPLWFLISILETLFFIFDAWKRMCSGRWCFLVFSPLKKEKTSQPGGKSTSHKWLPSGCAVLREINGGFSPCSRDER